VTRPTAIVTDIEGTTSSITFVHDVLFPYAREHLPRFVHENRRHPEVAAALATVAAEVGSVAQGGASAEPSDDELVRTLIRWIDTDRKHTALKTLQGMIWERGYEDGVFQGHVYDDAAVHLQKWKRRGLMLAVFSSGSVPAQRLIFGHSTHGDLTPCFSAYFDTTTGAKREAGAYGKIAAALGTAPGRILYLSDIEAELDAAKAAGMRTMQVVRPGTTPSAKHDQAATFADVDAAL
jgi:enolase-phosphatase E1